MPGPPPIGQQVRWNVQNGNLYWTDDEGLEHTTTWHEATNGKVYGPSNRLHFTDWRNQIRYTARANIDPYVTFTEGDRFMIIQPTELANVNAPDNLAESWLARFSVEVTSPDGTVYRKEDNITWASPAGKRLIINEALGARGAEQYQSISQAYDVTLSERLLPGFRFATPREALERAVSAILAHDWTEQLNDLIAEGIENPDGTEIDNISDAARWVFAHGSLDVTPFTGAIFSYSGDYFGGEV